MLACAAAPDHAFEERALQTQYDRMQGLAYALLAATEPTADGTLSLSMFRLPDSRLNNPGAGLASALIDERGGLTWGSISLTDDVPLPPMVAPGEWSFESTDTSFILAFGLRWANPVEGDQTYTLLIIEDRATFRRQVAGFRRTLWSWLAVAAIGLLSVQGAILAWGLGPLRRLRRDLRLVEKGKQTALGGRYPQELVPLSEAINGMISTGQAQLERHRHALGDLAHSLKTPLAVLQGVAEGNGILGHLFGSKEVSRAVAAQAEQATGIGQEIFKQMLPVIASTLMGGMFKQSTGQVSQASAPGGNFMAEMMEQLMQAGRQPTRPAQNPMDNPFGQALNQMFGGGSDGGGKPAANPMADNPWGKLFTEMMGGGQSEPEPEPKPRGNAYEELFGQMFETGRQTQDTYQKGIDDIFDQYLRGMIKHR